MKELKDRSIPYKIYLTEDEMPKYWYNVRADMTNKPAPLMNPATLKPMTAEEAILQMNLLEHEFFVFLNVEDEDSFSVVYKRKNGGYGLISATDA